MGSNRRRAFLACQRLTQRHRSGSSNFAALNCSDERFRPLTAQLQTGDYDSSAEDKLIWQWNDLVRKAWKTGYEVV